MEPEKKLSLRNILNRTKSKNVEDMEKFKDAVTTRSSSIDSRVNVLNLDNTNAFKDLHSELNDAVMEGNVNMVQSLVAEGTFVYVFKYQSTFTPRSKFLWTN